MNVLIAGKTSYIGNHIGQYVLSREPGAKVTYIGVRDDGWKDMDLSGYDAVVFAAAIVHRKDITDPEVYHRVNALLPFSFAQKAKAEGVRHFLLISTAAVYGVGKGLPRTNIISADTPLAPDGPYGQSKLDAERMLQTLEDDSFALTLVRTINVYGKDCPGNYISQFMKIAKLLPVHPRAYNGVKQGFVHVKSLSKLCYLALKAGKGGIYHPQDPAPVSSYEILQSLSKAMGIRRLTLPCHTLVRLLPRVSPVMKFFGGVAYDDDLTVCDLGDYHVTECKEGLAKVLEE